MEYTFTKEDIELIRKFEEIKNRGYYADGNQVTQTYNRVFGTNLSSTSCGTCIRQRIQQMVDTLNHFEQISKKQEEIKASEPSKNDEVENVTPDNNKASEEPKKRVGRPKKS